jgi:hypothetical protein
MGPLRHLVYPVRALHLKSFYQDSKLPKFSVTLLVPAELLN